MKKACGTRKSLWNVKKPLLFPLIIPSINLAENSLLNFLLSYPSMITPIKDINWDSTSRVYKVQGYINYFNRTQASIRGSTEILTHYNYYISDGTTPKQYSRDAENIILNTKYNPAKQLKITMVSSTFKIS